MARDFNTALTVFIARHHTERILSQVLDMIAGRLKPLMPCCSKRLAHSVMLTLT